MHRTPRTRRGSALMMVMAIVVVLLALTWTLSTNTVGRLQAERARDDQVELIAACESAANETVAWMSTYPDLIKPTSVGGPLPEHAEVVLGPTSAEGQYTVAAALDSTQKVINSTYTGTSQAMIPLLKDTTYGTDAGNPNKGKIPGCYENMRNGCTVESMIVCLHATAAGGSFPDGNEKYMVIATATKGDKTTDYARYQRRRIMTVVSPQPTQVFKQTMYSISSYDVGGSAGTDSWNGTGTYAGATDSTHHGDIKSGGTITTSGSSSVDGTKTSNFKLPLPTLTYTPSAGATPLGAVTTSQTLTGGSDYRASSWNAGVTVTGSGTVTLYVDGPFNTNSIRYAAGSTAKLVIKQANYSSSLGTTQFDLGSNALIGDVGEDKSHGTTIYTSENDASVGPDATRLQFYTGFTGDTTFNGTGDLAAVIYAPNANLKMNGTFQFFGAIVADAFDGKVNGTFNFHFDDRLGSLTLPLNPQFSATGWNIYNVAVNQN